MIRRIVLTNVMSHRLTVIEPADGLTVIAGENNCGKSAVVAGLQILCENAQGDYMVRHNERECAIEVETAEGHLVQWRRKGDKVTYCLDGREIDRLGGSIPDGLHRLLRLPLVEAHGEPFDVHFAEQKQPIFLLNESASRRATFFASSSDAARLMAMQRLHKRKVHEAKARMQVLDKEKARHEVRLASLDPIDGLEKRLRRVESQYDELQAQLKRAEQLQRLSADIKRARSARGAWSARSRALQDLRVPPELKPTERLVEILADIARTADRMRSNLALATVTSELKEPPELDNTQDLVDRIRALRQAQMAIAKANARAGVVAECPRPPALKSTADLDGLIGAIERFGNSAGMHGAQAKTLANLTEPRAPTDVTELSSFITWIEQADHKVANCKHEFQNSLAAEAVAEKELRRVAHELRTCPTCGQKFDAGRLVVAAATTQEA